MSDQDSSSEANPKPISSKMPASSDIDPSVPRRINVANVFHAYRYVVESFNSGSVKQRFSDSVTLGLVFLCITSLILAIFVPVPPFIKICPLFLTWAAVISYIVNRLGILTSLSPRQAILVGEIIMASFWMGVISAMLITLICFHIATNQYGGVL